MTETHASTHTSLCVIHHSDTECNNKNRLIFPFIYISLDSLVRNTYKYSLYSVTLIQGSIGYFKACVYTLEGVHMKFRGKSVLSAQ